MKILVCPDKFKGSLSAAEFCDIAQKTLSNTNHQVKTLPLADGGDGSLKAIEEYLPNSIKIKIKSFDPLFRPIETYYLVDNDIAYVELALQSGLVLLGDLPNNVSEASSFGTGMLIKDAVQRGCRKIYLFAGGSATIDGGLGIGQACGYDFVLKNKIVLQRNIIQLADLEKVTFDGPTDFSSVQILLATDVKNKLLGPDGASHTYGPQKGASQESLPLFEKSLHRLNQVILEQTNIDVSQLEGSGAAGGIALVVAGLMGGSIISASQFILELCQVEKHIQEADIIITGEGRFDQQSFQGKLVGEIIKLCNIYSKPCYIICGQSELSSQENYEVWSLQEGRKS